MAVTTVVSGLQVHVRHEKGYADLAFFTPAAPLLLLAEYEVKDRGRVTARLRTLADQLRKAKKMDITRCSIISRARMPIIKASMGCTVCPFPASPLGSIA